MNYLKNISDINECNEESDHCHENATCSDTDGSYNCTCNSGFSGNGTYCEGWFQYLMLINIYVLTNQKIPIKLAPYTF